MAPDWVAEQTTWAARSWDDAMNESLADRIVQCNLDVHEQEADVYDAIHPEILGEWEQRRIERDLGIIASALQGTPQPRVMDLGCGTGNLTVKFLRRGCSVLAVDVSPQMLQQLRSKMDPGHLGRLELVVGDAESIVCDARTYGSWDVVSISSVLHHLPRYGLVLTHALRQLRPDGILYVCHEPLQGATSQREMDVGALLARSLSFIDSLYIRMRKLAVYALASVRDRRPFRRIDYSLSDYHARTGIDAQAVLAQLAQEGFVVLLFEAYSSFFWSLIASLDARLQVSPPTHFRLLAQRQEREQTPLGVTPLANQVALGSCRGNDSRR